LSPYYFPPCNEKDRPIRTGTFAALPFQQSRQHREPVAGHLAMAEKKVELVDLPGTYNLSPDSLDQQIAEQVIRGGEYDLILNVVDASNLSRNLYLTMDLKERTDRMVVLLNMVDIADTAGLDKIGCPQWLTILLSQGIGSGCQTVATFVPVVFFMFLALAILEDLGYMSRVAVTADRFMRKIGLPGNAFIPMVVGFGCTVPAIMSARTLTTKRDRFMTIFMAPFMSCGARLPVYALFCAALFGPFSGLAVFSIYLAGLLMAILTGFLLKNTLFRGNASHFVMDLPHYHLPRLGAITQNAWLKTLNFIKRAGLIVVLAVTVLSGLNSMGWDNGTLTFGNEGSESSLLATAGKAIAPVFEPMGIQRDNWPASVALFTGLFAKESIVGTINSLYATMGEDTEPQNLADMKEFPDIGQASIEALMSIQQNFIGLITSFDIIGISLIAQDQATISEEIGADTVALQNISRNFT
ncbi:unnamed protein product, partial [Cyprideis torosa]